MADRQIKTIQWTINLPMDFPLDWDDDMIEFHLNESSWCCSNLINELEKYSNKTVKRSWTKWYLNEIRFTDINGKDVRCNYLYRTNGKKVQIRCGAFKAEATCCKDDEFEIEKGLNLAKKRLVVKYLDNQVKSIAKAM